MTFLEGREEGARVEMEGARSEEAVGFRPAGDRRMDAVEAVGRREVELDGLGGFWMIDGLGMERKGGGMESVDSVGSLFGMTLEEGSGILFLV